jgi:HD-like signal output (HDOD) protein
MDNAFWSVSGFAKKFPMPDLYRKTRLLMENPNVKLIDFEKLMQTEPLLAVVVIRMANSDFWRFDRKVHTLHDAIALVGAGQLHDVLLGSLFMRLFTDLPGQTLSCHDFWQQGIKRGIAARGVARYCRLPADNRFFTLGLLLEIDHAAMYAKAPELSAKALRESREQGRPIETVERERFGFDHCQLGSALLRQWHLPEFFPQVIENQLRLDQAKPIIRDATDIAYLAHCLCEPSETLVQQKTRLLNSHQQMMEGRIVTREIASHADEIYEIL